MRVEQGAIAGTLLFVPSPHSDERGLFTRTFDAAIRAMHGRSGRGEAKLVRCARGAVFDVLVDARPGSPTFGERMSVVLDDEAFVHLYVPPGLLHGYQALSDADVCYRIDRPHDPAEDVSVRYDDPDLAIDWPLPVSAISARDLAAGSWKQARRRLEGWPRGARPASAPRPGR
jgi:dTDP-4-dehydrorhamnose 3,5-epimerase